MTVGFVWLNRITQSLSREYYTLQAALLTVKEAYISRVQQISYMRGDKTTIEPLPLVSAWWEARLQRLVGLLAEGKGSNRKDRQADIAFAYDATLSGARTLDPPHMHRKA
jgi:hypothetical protein